MHFLSILGLAAVAVGQLTSSSLEKHVDSVTLSKSFNPIKEAYWTGYPHHRRTPFAVSPDGKSAYLAYLDSSETGVHVQPIDPTTFAATGDLVTISGGKEAGGLVAHNDGFAILTNEALSGVTDPVAVLYRYTNGKETFKTYLGGPDVDQGQAMMSPDMNGDLVFSEKAGYYAAYIVVTAYEGSATGHFGDAIRYVDTTGKLTNIAGASSSWGCSHNTGIAFEAADEAPFASLCAEDQGAIWLNTKTQGMTSDGVKVSNEHVINGGANEAMGGMSGSYSVLARFIGADSYIFSWVSRGAKDLTANEWMGSGYTTSKNRTNNRNVAIALFSDKNTLVGDQATSEVGAADGDKQVNWMTSGANDCSNAHAAAFDSSKALVTWEEISNPICDFDAMGCKGTFVGTKFQMVGSDGKKVGEAVSVDDTYVAGDMVTMSDGRICWPYVSMDWKLDGPVTGSPVSKMSFACMSGGSGSGGSASAAPASSAAASTAAPVASSAPAVSSTEAVDAVATSAGSADPTFASGAAPEPIFSTISGSALPSSSAPVASAPAVVPSSEPVVSVPAETQAAASSSFSAPAGAPEPSFVTISADPVASSAPAGTGLPSSSAPAASAPAVVPSSEPVASVPAETQATASSSFSAPAGAPEPSFVTISADPVASSAPAGTGLPVETIPDAPATSAASADPVATQAPSSAGASKTKTRKHRTKTRKHRTKTRKGPKPTKGAGKPGGSGCVNRTTIHTVYVTRR